MLANHLNWPNNPLRSLKFSPPPSCSRMRLCLGKYIGTCKPTLRHVSRSNNWAFGSLAGSATSCCRLVTTVTSSCHRRSVLPLVLSAVNLALPPGPFDDPAVTHRASCNAGLIQHEEEEQLLPLFLHSTSLSRPIGFLRPKVAHQILQDHQGSGKRSIWNVLVRPDDSPWAVCFADHVAGFETRTHAMRVVLERWKTEGLFSDILKGMNGCYHRVPMNSDQCIRLEQRNLPRVYTSTGTS